MYSNNYKTKTGGGGGREAKEIIIISWLQHTRSQTQKTVQGLFYLPSFNFSFIFLRSDVAADGRRSFVGKCSLLKWSWF